ncbi:hypothetical protein B0H21DRAFT_186856 [Amylocystis lapponica]|nr:hypothetical protein B0H21DRAFT_186856 [Amylocystis lapponica]
MHIPFTPNHLNLISACYPPSAALVTAGPEYLPNSQELSRLTYYAANRPGKINKLSSELEKKVKVDCRKAQAGNARARASLLITLAIFKSLAAECRRDISLLTASLIASVKATLSTLSADLEVVARVANVFTAWTTYTDGHIIGVDREVTEDYISCLQHFSDMGKTMLEDDEVKNRTRLVSLAAITASMNSEALFNSSTTFKQQVSTLMPAVLTPLLEVDIATLSHEASDIKEQPMSAALNEFRTRPAMERRAASIHLHIDGDKGPSEGDVTNAALRALYSLLGHSNGNQAAVTVAATIEHLDNANAWDSTSNCCWCAEKAAEWTQYQYRYAIPTRLVECLAEGQDAPHSTSRHSTLAAMITTVFTSPTPLVNLSTSDIISSLITLIFRRIAIDPADALLPTLVECIASLGTHVYYADQIQDLAGELISRLVLVETNGVPTYGRAHGEKARTEAVRCLLAGLLGIIHAADMHEAAKDAEAEAEKDKEPQLAGTSPTLPSPTSPTPRDVHVRPSRRTKVPPEVWHDTLVLLCDSAYAVRADYAVALVSYLAKEVPRLDDHVDADGVRRTRTLIEGPSQQASKMAAMVYGDATTRFLHALHAYLYALATSSTWTFPSASSTPSPEDFKDGAANSDARQSRDTSRRSINLPRSRKTSVIMRVLEQVPSQISPSVSTNALRSDYGNILGMLTAVHESLPVRGLLIGVPMLLALSNAAHVDESADASVFPLAQAIEQVVARTWLTIGKVWNCPEVIEIAEKAFSSISTVDLPSIPDLHPGTFHPPRDGLPFASESTANQTLPTLDTQALVLAVSSSPNVQEATGLDQQTLLQRLSAPWTAQSAYKESLETRAGYQDGLTPLVKVAPTLMHIDNKSLQSLARSTRGVGVTDLREALQGRNGASNTNLANRAPSISTLDHMSSVMPDPFHKLTPTKSRPQRSKLAGPGEVRDVLNKLGIGKQNGTPMLKPSFPTLQRPEQKPPAFTPPYKT